MKALIIDEPWITAILKGDKTWEMRKKNCNIRGQIALIRKGSGQVVGTANVVDSKPPLATRADYAAAEQHHRIPPCTAGAGVYGRLAHAMGARECSPASEEQYGISIHPAQWSG